MIKRLILVFYLSQSFLFLLAQKTDKKLSAQIAKAIEGYNGNVGVFVKNLRTGKTVAINADTVFPTASIVKVQILLGVMDKIEKGELKYDSVLVYKDSLLYEGEDILGSFKNDEKILLSKVMMLMLTTSDNTASLWLQSLAGGGARLNEITDSLGFVHTKVNSRTPGRRPIWEKYGWGQTTPREIAAIFEKIYRYEIFTNASCDRMMRSLSRNFYDQNGALSQIPPYIAVVTKHGSVDAARGEILLVNAPGNPYLFSILTSNNKDTTWTPDNEAWRLARKISRIIWNHYKKKDNWVPLID